MATDQTRDPVLGKAIELAGGPAALARFITDFPGQKPITAQAICDWIKCPPRRAIPVAEATGREVNFHDLRPDIFGPTPAAASTAATAAAPAPEADSENQREAA